MKQRIISGVLAAIVFLAMAYLGGLWFSCLILFLALVGLYEFLKMAGIRAFSFPGLLSYLLMVSLMWPQLLIGKGTELSFSLLLMPVMVLLLFASVYRKNKFHIEHAALAILGALYIGFGFLYLLATRNIADNGLFLTILVLFGIWASDSGAYFVGKALGKHKLWPEISPNKTVEGALGGLVFAVFIVCLVNAGSGFLSFPRMLAIGLVASLVGQMGDLIESAIKRHFGVKDSGNILPGHGGVLDRCDSWLIVFPILHLFQFI